MRGNWRRVLIALVLGTIFALGVRVAVVAWRLEFSGELLSTIARDALPGWMSPGSPWRQSNSLEDQARFWLAESDRILAEDPSAENLIGAAWMLDVWATQRAWELDPAFCSLFDEASSSGRAWGTTGHGQFAARARERMIELAEQATQSAPDRPGIWRAWASLWVDELAYASHDKSRHAKLFAMLDEARQHDPGNGLYDYIAARQLLYASTAVDDNPNDSTLAVTAHDPETLAKGLACFQRAQQQAFVDTGNDNWQPLLQFLDRTRVPRHERLPIAASRLTQGIDRWVFDSLIRFQSLYLKGSGTSADPAPLCRQVVRIAKQLEAGNVGGKLWESPSFEFWMRRELSTSSTDVTQADLLAEVDQVLVAIRQRKLIRDAAVTNLTTTGPFSGTIEDFLLALAACALAPACLFALTATLLTGLLARYLLKDAEAPRWRWAVARHGWCWLATIALSFLFLGIGPSGIVEESLARFAGHLLATVVPASLVLGLMVFALRRARAQRARFVLVGIILLAGALLARFPNRAERMALWFEYHLRVDEIGSYWLRVHLPALQSQSLEWALTQWKYHHGLTWSVSIALALIALWYWLWSGGRKADPATRLVRAGGAAREVSRSAAAATAVGLLLFLALLPRVLEDADMAATARLAYFQEQYEAGGTLIKSIRAIEADPAKMEELRVWAEQQIQGERPK